VRLLVAQEPAGERAEPGAQLGVRDRRGALGVEEGGDGGRVAALALGADRLRGVLRVAVLVVAGHDERGEAGPGAGGGEAQGGATGDVLHPAIVLAAAVSAGSAAPRANGG
jgi:hypothetical protein